jgi:hypothetical protein
MIYRLWTHCEAAGIPLDIVIMTFGIEPLFPSVDGHYSHRYNFGSINSLQQHAIANRVTNSRVVMHEVGA